MASPNARPKIQNRIPISSSLCPSIESLRKLTEDKSGSFRLASPPSVGWARAAVAPVTAKANAPAKVLAKRHPWDAALASQVRIKEPPGLRIIWDPTYFG